MGHKQSQYPSVKRRLEPHTTDIKKEADQREN